MARRVVSSRRRFTEYAADRRRKRQDDPKTRPARRSRSFLTLARALWSMVGEFRPRVVLAMLTVSIATMLSLLMPAYTKVAVDSVIVPTPSGRALIEALPLPGALADDRLAQLLTIGGLMIGTTIVRIMVGMWGRWKMTLLTKRVQVSMRRRVFDHAVRLPLHRVHQMKSGGVASILREDAGNAGQLLFTMLYNPWQAVLQLIGTLIILAWVDWRMLVGALAFLPLVAISHRTWIAKIRPVDKDIRATRTAIDAHATEAFGGMRVVRAFNRARGETIRFVGASHFMSRKEMLAWWWSRAIDVLWNLLIPLASTSVLVYGGWRVIEGELSIGAVMMFSAYVLMLLGPMELLAVSATDAQTHLAGLDRVLDVLAEPREFADRSDAHPITPQEVRGRVTFEDVWFSYPPAHKRAGSTEAEPSRDPVLREISLDVLPGRTVALVGPSGSGKTTLCNLVARFFDPTRGRILLDGRDLRDITVESYRSLLGIVEQDVFLFDGTVADNIGYARRDATMDQLRHAARTANAHEFIEALEHGYDTLIGERGVRLSGGQKQRLAIARAVLADPRILILDEATSNLDTQSEQLIQTALADLMRTRTCFVIAHRLSTVRSADLIVVLEGGRIVERGTHDQLLTLQGRYARFLDQQVRGFAADDVRSSR